jgi:type IV pilus assembly protein PilQ
MIRRYILQKMVFFRRLFVLIAATFTLLFGFTYSVEVFAKESIKLQAAKLIELSPSHAQIELQLSAPLSSAPLSFTQLRPARIVIDLPGVQSTLAKQYNNIGKQGIKSIRVLTTVKQTRILLDLVQPLSYTIKQQGKNIVVDFNSPTAVDEIAAHGQLTLAVFKPKSAKSAELTVSLSNSDTVVDVQKQDEQLLVLFNDTQAAANLLHTTNVAQFGTPIKQFSLQQLGKQAQLQILTQGGYNYSAYQVGGQYVITFNPQTITTTNQNAGPTINSADIPTANYQGKKISLNFQDIKVRSVLQLLAEFTGINIVASDTVQGSMTLQLNNIPWDQALDIILQTRGLAKRQVGNVMLVGPIEEFANRERKELEAKQDVNTLVALRSELLPINYAKAQDIATLLKAQGNTLLSPRGNVSVDNRTNTLWIQDVPSNLVQLRQFVAKLDIPVKQVLIEARIVNIDRRYEEGLGVRFGITSPNHVSGNLTGASALAGGTAPSAIALADRLNVDLQAPSVAGSGPATVGIALAKLGGHMLLDLELSALESENAAEIISTPRIITANQMPAKIESGQEIPYQETSSSGGTSVSFKKAVLRLDVTPQITPDGRLILNLKVNQDAPGSQLYNGVPVITTRNIDTQVLVDNGQTVVLGGVYEQSKGNQVKRVPFLGDLPLVGALFRNKYVSNQKTELLIFVTPKIIKQMATNQ